jgi:hypothetical protein
MRPPDAEAQPIDKELYKMVIENTKRKYGKDKDEIEKEIKDRGKLLF